VEELPENRLGGGVDGANQPLPEGPIDPNGPQTIPVDLPVDAINWDLHTQFGAKDVIGTSLSNPNYQPDRSAYLCNYLGYKLAETFSGTKTAAGFVHVTESTPPAQMHVLLESVVAREREKARATALPVS
jgi:pyrrolidone-carboxylate peptidase